MQAKSKPAASAKSAAKPKPAAAKSAKPSKTVKPAKPEKAARPAPAKPVLPAEAPKRVKLVRDSFTMPREDFDLIAQLKARALRFQRPTKKSELLRAGLQVLAALPEKQLQAALEALRPLKAGRPKNKH